jgi:hypothetical protein
MGKTRIKVAMTTTILRKIVLFLVEFDVKVQICRMVVGFTTTCAIGAHHHLSCEFESHS